MKPKLRHSTKVPLRASYGLCGFGLLKVALYNRHQKALDGLAVEKRNKINIVIFRKTYLGNQDVI